VEGRQRSFKRVAVARRLKRAFAGMPFIISVATGPGRIAFSRDATGELVVLPLHPGMEIDVREHAFVLGSHQIDYSFVRVKGLTNILFGGQGMFMDRFVTTGVQAWFCCTVTATCSSASSRPAKASWWSRARFLYKDSSVSMAVEFQQLSSGFFGGTNMSLARMTGPDVSASSPCTSITTPNRQSALHQLCSAPIVAAQSRTARISARLRQRGPARARTRTGPARGGAIQYSQPAQPPPRAPQPPIASAAAPTTCPGAGPKSPPLN